MLTKNELAEIQARADTMFPSALNDDVPRLLEHIKSQGIVLAGMNEAFRLVTRENGSLFAALRQAEPGCLHPTDGRTVGGFDPAHGRYTVVKCWVCKREIQIYVVSMERVGKHMESCVFAMLED